MDNNPIEQFHVHFGHEKRIRHMKIDNKIRLFDAFRKKIDIEFIGKINMWCVLHANEKEKCVITAYIAEFGKNGQEYGNWLSILDADQRWFCFLIDSHFANQRVSFPPVHKIPTAHSSDENILDYISI